MMARCFYRKLRLYSQPKDIITDNAKYVNSAHRGNSYVESYVHTLEDFGIKLKRNNERKIWSTYINEAVSYINTSVDPDIASNMTFVNNSCMQFCEGKVNPLIFLEYMKCILSGIDDKEKVSRSIRYLEFSSFAKIKAQLVNDGRSIKTVEIDDLYNSFVKTFGRKTRFSNIVNLITNGKSYSDASDLCTEITLAKKINGCFRCGSKHHLVKECKKKAKKVGNFADSLSGSEESSENDTIEVNAVQIVKKTILPDNQVPKCVQRNPSKIKFVAGVSGGRFKITGQ
uniref:CCHC-type domain-containing protein n=1 Tax=Strongyloides papillosus TaxID=174720 RepID=A0A0N5B1Q9_STREA